MSDQEEKLKLNIINQIKEANAKLESAIEQSKNNTEELHRMCYNLAMEKGNKRRGKWIREWFAEQRRRKRE